MHRRCPTGRFSAGPGGEPRPTGADLTPVPHGTRDAVGGSGTQGPVAAAEPLAAEPAPAGPPERGSAGVAPAAPAAPAGDGAVSDGVAPAPADVAGRSADVAAAGAAGAGPAARRP